ncbi:MAG TPA: Arc family DNA-binding protein [Gemmatimonadaceae bacterium]|nr:Arc family DNA-binding protein [Gemmatimonadaceae bacterium]
MASLTLKGVPGDLLARLKREAAEHRRSLNGEVIYRLENSVADADVRDVAGTSAYRWEAGRGRALTIAERKDIDAEDWLRRVREVRDRLDIHTTTAEIIEARDFGRE